MNSARPPGDVTSPHVAGPPDEARPDEAWEAVLSAALVGTARRPPPPAVVRLADTGAASPGDPEPALLATAALLAAYRRAGRLPGTAPPDLPAPAGPDGRPLCSETAADVLELLASGELPLPGGPGALLAEWLAGAARAGCRPPARLLPRLLDLGTSVSLRPTLLEVAGLRGRWLARHHEPWAWAAAGAQETAGQEESIEQRFATAGRTDRLALLRQLRTIDPSRGRLLLTTTWGREPAPERAALLGELLTGLSDEDEPFLEAALDDRAAAVRETAVGLLARLPASRRAVRMTERLRPLVRATGGRRRLRLEVARPPEPDAAARRDGITDHAPAGTGRSAWHLLQLVAGTPLSFWTGHLGGDPASVVALAADQAPEVLLGLEAAAAAQAGRADPAWALALFSQRPLPAVLAALPPDLAAQCLTRFLAGNPAPGGTVASLLAACPGPWPESLAAAVVDRYIHLGARAGLEMPASLSVLAERLDPSVLPLVETWALSLAGEDALRRRVRTLASALSLRAVIREELA